MSKKRRFLRLIVEDNFFCRKLLSNQGTRLQMDIKKLLVTGLFTIGLIIVLKMVGEKVKGLGALMERV